MKPFLARQWPLAPAIAATTGAIWLRSWPLVAVLGITVIGALAWERRCSAARRRRASLNALTANARRLRPRGRAVTAPEPYWADDRVSCACQCGGSPNPGRKFITGHNLRVIERTEEYRRRIGEGQKRAWGTKRQRMPLGSTRLDVKGYILVKTVPGEGRWEKKHVLVMQAAIGRLLTRSEQVHHINGVKTDNGIGNLILCADCSDHMNIEVSFKRLLPELMARGIVIFDRSGREYRLV